MSNSALIVDCGVATIAAGPVFTAAAAGAGSTFSVRNAALTSGVQLVDTWFKGPHAGQIRITSPNLVPVANGIRLFCPTGLADFQLPRDNNQSLIPQDALAISLNGTALDVNGVAIQSYYENLPGGAMVLKNPGDISGVTDFVFSWPCAAAASATAGAQGSTPITTTVDSSSANTWYAVLGYQTDTTVLAAGISGVDTSQLFVGGPGDPVGHKTYHYFEELSMLTGQPCIPLFNSANKGSTNVVVVDNVASTTVNVSLILAQLVSTYTP